MEWKKTFGSPLLVTVLCILILMNGILFFQGQRQDNQKEINTTYLSQLKHYQMLLGSDSDVNKEIFAELSSNIEEENIKLRAYSFVYDYEQAKKNGENTEFYEFLYDDYVKGITIPDILPDPKQIQIQKQVNDILKKQIDYLCEYTDSIASILKNAEQMSKIQKFAKEGSFSKKNILQTAKDFQVIAEKEVKLIPIRGMNAWLLEERTDYFAVAFLLLLVAEFFRERKKGLWHMIHASFAGRFPLALRRLGVLVITGILLPLIFYGSTLLISLFFYGEFSHLHEILSAPIQSFPDFGHCTLSVTVGEFLFLRILLKMFVITSFGTLFYAVMSIFTSTGSAVLAAGTVLGVEFLTYHFIPVQSFANVFKFINLFPLLAGREFFTNYQNLNLFTNPVSSTKGAFVGLFVLFVLSGLIAIEIQIKKYPVSSDAKTSKLWDQWRKRRTISSKQTNIFLIELYKQIITGHGWVVFVFLAFLMIKLYPQGRISYTEQDAILQSYYQQFEGEVTQETLTFLETGEQKISQGTFGSPVRIQAFYQFKDYVQGLLDYEAEHKTKLFVVSPFGYEAFFYPNGEIRTIFETQKHFDDLSRALLSVVSVVLLTAPFIPFEKQKGAYSLLRSMNHGREKLFWFKWLVALVDCFFVWLIVYGLEFAGMARLYGLPGLNAPVRSMFAFRNIPFSGSIAEYLIVLYLLRLLTLIFVAAASMAITSFFKEVRPAVLCSVLLLVVPVALSYIGISNLIGEQMVSWLIAQYQFRNAKRLLTYLIPAILGGIGIWTAWYRWNKTRKTS